MFKCDVVCVVLAYCEYKKVAVGYGGVGYQLDCNLTDEGIFEMLEKAQEVSHSGIPVLVNCLFGKTNFVMAPISHGVRRVELHV